MPDGWRYRTNWRGKVILQRRYRTLDDYPMFWKMKWYDAQVEDLFDFYEDLQKNERPN
jgi:hypothetical protein